MKFDWDTMEQCHNITTIEDRVEECGAPQFAMPLAQLITDIDAVATIEGHALCNNESTRRKVSRHLESKV